ncbi:hypothetical protein D3C72_2203910 [compost metagenome]
MNLVPLSVAVVLANRVCARVAKVAVKSLLLVLALARTHRALYLRFSTVMKFSVTL